MSPPTPTIMYSKELPDIEVRYKNKLNIYIPIYTYSMKD